MSKSPQLPLSDKGPITQQEAATASPVTTAPPPASQEAGGAFPGLAKMREPFPEHQVSKLPKPTKAQTTAVRDNFKVGKRCEICGTWHHPDVAHLDYVGHAALTDRLLDTDLNWNWEPLASDEHGLPLFDRDGGLWIRLTVCGQTRLGYGDAGGKLGGDATKEKIGDALRNAAMRFGAALDLWFKGGDLHPEAPGSGDGEPELTRAELISEITQLAIRDRMRDDDIHRCYNELADEMITFWRKAGDHVLWRILRGWDKLVAKADELDLRQKCHVTRVKPIPNDETGDGEPETPATLL